MADDCEDALKKHRDLLIACGWGKEVDVILLLQQGASVRVQDQDGKNCLHYSSCKGHIQVTNLLIENGCAINAKDKTLRTPLHLAAEEGHHDIVSILLDNNAEFNEQDEEGNTPIHVACINGYVDVIELLIHIKADLNIKNKDGFTPLHVATINNHPRSMALLMRAGVNKSAQDKQGNTAVHVAVNIKSMRALKCLIKHGADVNIQNHDGNTALHLCADTGSQRFVECILSADQPVELSPNNVGDTAKDIAIRHGYKEISNLIPDPFKEKKVRRKKCSSESPASPAVSHGSQSPLHGNSDQSENILSPNRLRNNNNKIECNRSFLQHPSEEIPTATSSSMCSLWVPTTDSGISLPMDNIKDDIRHNSLNSSYRKKYRKHEKSKLVEDLRAYDLHSKDDKDDRKYKQSRRKEMTRMYEYEELRYDPRFMSPQVHKKYTTPANRTSFQLRYSEPFDSGALSDESLEISGCFFKGSLTVNSSQQTSKNIIRTVSLYSEKNKKKPNSRTKHRSPKKTKDDSDIIQRQAELYFQLNNSKVSLEKQMRKMRKRFEKALLATDERFLEQKKREQAYHNQIRSELEHIEKSLERGSKKNVEEYTQHIKAELNNLAQKLTKGLDLNSSDSDSNTKINKRASAVDLDKQISVSLSSQGTLRKKKSKNKDETDSPGKQRTIMQLYEQRLKELEKDAHLKDQKEKENEALRARVQELEKMISFGQGSGQQGHENHSK